MYDGGFRVTLNSHPLYGVDDQGSELIVDSVDGLLDGAVSTLATTQKIWGHGFFSNIPHRAGRTISLTGYIVGVDTQATIRSWDLLKQALLLTDQELEVNLRGLNRMVVVKQDDQPLVGWVGDHTLKFSLQFKANSPYMYTGGSAGRKQGSTGLPRSEGGMTFPYHFESDSEESTWAFTETMVSGSVSLTNSGTAPSPLLVRVDGPCNQPVVEHLETGMKLSLAGELGAGHYVTFNSESHEVLLDGSQPARGMVLSRSWQDAQPGTNTWGFSAADGGENALLTVSFREAWL